ncbi:glycosyltransferase [Akkermansiaceae bacterium]|nr:glycosyltransferase [Akkermansiaceae bacterium]
MNKVSVIVPVYNVEKYLKECIESIINQTYQNLEIILVDDGSTDRSLSICERFAGLDRRIWVIRKDNGGPGAGSARNVGLERSTGEYLTSVDSDDILSEDMFELMVTAIEKFDADIAACNYSKFQDGSEEEVCVKRRRIESKPELLDPFHAIKRLLNGEFNQVVWAKIYKRTVIGNFRFEEGVGNEDEFWTYRLLGESNLIVQIPDILLYYRQHSGSIMGFDYNLDRLRPLQAFENRVKYVRENYPTLVNLAKQKLVFGCLFHYQLLQKNPKIDPEGKHRQKVLRRVEMALDKSFTASLSKKELIWIRLFCLLPDSVCYLRNVLKIGT